MRNSRKTTIFALNAVAVSMALSVVPDHALAGDAPFIGEILRVPYTFCPNETLEANGQLLPIDDYSALFALLGTRFGGDGQFTFALPDLRGRAPIGTSQTVALGNQLGQESVTLTTSQMASHSHTVNASNADGDLPGPGGKILAAAPPGGTGAETIYSDQPSTVTMSPSMISQAGNNLPFSVVDPYVVIRYCVATVGIFPSRS